MSPTDTKITPHKGAKNQSSFFSVDTEKIYFCSPLFGEDYELTAEQIIEDSKEVARSFEDLKECTTITYGMYPPFRDLSPYADDLWRGDQTGEGFDLWCDVFETEIENMGFYLTGDEGDGTVVWLHTPNCQCHRSIEEKVLGVLMK